jgi:hypothetical protein
MLLRIPISATNLSPIAPPSSEAKLMFDAVAELVELARQLGISAQEEETL